MLCVYSPTEPTVPALEGVDVERLLVVSVPLWAILRLAASHFWPPVVTASLD